MKAVGSVIERVLPSPYSIGLGGAGLNLGMLFVIALSRNVLCPDTTRTMVTPEM
jgi:hypothetical protein